MDIIFDIFLWFMLSVFGFTLIMYLIFRIKSTIIDFHNKEITIFYNNGSVKTISYENKKHISNK